MTRGLLMACWVLVGLATVPATGQDELGGVPFSEREMYRPTPTPDRIILTFADDPATTLAVTWRTSADVTKAVGQIALAEDGPDFQLSGKVTTVEAVTEKLDSDLSLAHYHSVMFKGLHPKTRYVYRVGDGSNWSEWFQTCTASDQAEPFRFIYFGDAQNDIKSMWSRVIREANLEAPRAAFMLHAGDLINRANRDAEWGEWFNAGAWLNGMIPSIATPGNHEYAKPVRPGMSKEEADALKNQVSLHWRPQFTMPMNGPKVEGLEETVYYVDYQGARIISLNSNEKHEEQAAWLETILAKNPCKWTIITYHHPMFSAAKGRDNPRLRALWLPIFNKYGVDLVLQGHDHTYSRSDLVVGDTNVTEGATTQSQNGTVYVVSVSGPKMYILERHQTAKRAAERTQLFQIISIDGDTLNYEARTAVNTLYDAFTLKKRPGQPNELIERVPEVEERVGKTVYPNAEAAQKD